MADPDLEDLAARYHWAEGGRPGLAPTAWALLRVLAPALLMAAGVAVAVLLYAALA